MLTEAGIINTIHNNTHAGAHAATDKCTHTHMCTHTPAHRHTQTGACTHTHTHTQCRKGKTDYSVAGEGVTKHAASGPFSTFCHHVVTKCAAVTKRAGSASNLIHFVTLVTKRAATGPDGNLVLMAEL